MQVVSKEHPATIQIEAKPKATTFSLKTPYLSAGRVTTQVSQTDGLWIHTKMNAEGGENALHAHLDEDHAFIVLEGEVTFYDENGGETVLGAHEGIMLPKGVFYRYLNTGPGNLMIIRVGSGSRPSRRTATPGSASTASPYLPSQKPTTTSRQCLSPASSSAGRDPEFR